MITLIAHVRVRPEHVAAYEALMAEVCAKVREHEPGVAYYACSRSVDDPDVFVVIEVYRDGAAHAAHMAAPWVRNSLPQAARLMDGTPTIKQYVTAGSEPVRLSFTARAGTS